MPLLCLWVCLLNKTFRAYQGLGEKRAKKKNIQGQRGGHFAIVMSLGYVSLCVCLCVPLFRTMPMLTETERVLLYIYIYIYIYMYIYSLIYICSLTRVPFFPLPHHAGTLCHFYVSGLCVCVCERERDREREIARKRARE